MATKPKESSNVGKEKKVPPSSSSHITPTRSSTKLSSISSSTPKPSSSSPSSSCSTSKEKPVPNYLKPTISSRHDEALKPIKKHGADHDPNQRATLNRRRSFDKPPSSSRVQSALVSPGPKERRATGRSSSFSSKTITTTSSSKPTSDNKPLRSPKPAKSQPIFVKSTAKSTVPKKEASNASASISNRIPKSPSDQSQTVVVQNAEAKQEDTESLAHEEVAEVEREVNVCPEEPKPDDNDQHFGAADGEANSDETENKSFDVSTPILEELVKADIHDAGLEEKPADNTQLEGEEDDQNKKNEESSESHTEEGIASEAKEDVEEDKVNEIAVQETNVVVEENKNDGKTVDNETEEVACEGSNVDKEEEDVEEGKAEAAEAEGSVKRQGKKDNAPAYNDVIEETASKLLEKRKNKVKALVGAFETVIDYESK